jgi:anaphase-promoting complex subunit 3
MNQISRNRAVVGLEPSESNREKTTRLKRESKWINEFGIPNVTLWGPGITYLMKLFALIGSGFQALARYQCKRAQKILNSLPSSHKSTGWIQRKLACSYFEERQYTMSKTYFDQARRIEPWAVADLDHFSTVLWFLNKDGELSALSHELKELHRFAPETWVVIGNLLSLQKKEEEAIKSFTRATQLKANYAYAHTLIGVSIRLIFFFF